MRRILPLTVLLLAGFGLAWDYPSSDTCPDDGSGICDALVGPTTVAASDSAQFGMVTPEIAHPCGYSLTITVDPAELQPSVPDVTVNGESMDNWPPYTIPEDAEIVLNLTNSSESDVDATVTFTLSYLVQNPDRPFTVCPPK